MLSIRTLLCIVGILIYGVAFSQDTSLHLQIPSQYFNSVSKKAVTINESIDKKTQKVLDQMQKHELKLHRKLSKIDSLAAHNIFLNSEEKFNQLQEKLKNQSKNLTQYIPKLDTIATSFKFLEQHTELIGNLKNAKDKLSEATNKLKEFQSKLQSTEDVKKFLKERREYLKGQLEKFGFAKELKKINKEVYYYYQQINDYKEIFKDSRKAEKKAIELLSKTKLFKDFMQKNSMLASLFRMPGDPNDPAFAANLAGLQTRVQINSLVQNQIAAGGPNAQQAFQQNLQQAQSQIQKLKDKVNKLGGGSSDAELPDFKPNNQKTKSFLQRLEIGTNFQSQGRNGILPHTTDLGLSIGYKINDKSIVGVGGSYRLGWGHGWNNVRISNQGAGIRSFLDWKIKGTFYISGGYEMNYRPDLDNVNIPTRAGIFEAEAWQESGLVGLSKIVSVKSKLFKKTKAQLLWDLLSYQQVPKSQPIIFRISYNIK